jgi:excisionase family DNA binding protein
MAQEFLSNRWLTTAEAAEYLSLSQSHLNKLRCIGGGPRFSAATRAIRYNRSDLDAWMERHYRASTSDTDGQHALTSE